MAALQPSQRIALTSIALSAAMIAALDHFVSPMPWGGRLVAGAFLAGAFYRAGLQQEAHRKTADRNEREP